VVLATSAAPDELELLRSVLRIDDAVAEITAAQDVEAAKPEPDLIDVALQQAGVSADRAVYVGDTVWDVKALRQGRGGLCGRAQRRHQRCRIDRGWRSRGVRGLSSVAPRARH
jgi:phosphoglycolate phosphatase-like HAD superfamily hydrolase